MKILLLSFYYPPDLSAGSFRVKALVDSLLTAMPTGSSIDVVTTVPNRYSTFRVDAELCERRQGVAIHRIPLPPHKSGLLDQSRSFLVFARSALSQVADQEYDAMFATSSRLMTAVLAARIASRKKIPLYLDLRDIFVDTIKDVLPGVLAFSLAPLFGRLERWALSRATRINLVSPGFAEYFSPRYPEKAFTYFTNGIDDEFVDVPFIADQAGPNHPKRISVLYAGNIGEGQGLHAILPKLARKMSMRLSFRIIGDGGREEVLRAAMNRYDVDNVEILPPVERKQLIMEYRNADVLFLHLNDHEAFKKVLPSKIFEYAATGKPIWAGVAGYAGDFLRAEVPNAVVFSPCDADDAAQVFENLSMQLIERSDFISKFARANIMKKMAADILDMIHG